LRLKSIQDNLYNEVYENKPQMIKKIEKIMYPKISVLDEFM
jgi:hypothetical protein